MQHQVLTGVDQFFTLGSLSTLAGAAGATLVIANAFWVAFGWRPNLTGFFAAQAICHGLVALNGATAPLLYAIAFINACLVFVTASGGANMIGREHRPAATRTTRSGGSPRRSFFVTWW